MIHQFELPSRSTFEGAWHSISDFGLGETDFGDTDCNTIELADTNIPTATRLKCSLLSNPVFNFITGMVKGVTCTLTIKEKQMERAVKTAIDSVENSISSMPHEIACSVCVGATCPDGC